MATLTIGSRSVDVGDEFLRLSPEQQASTVEEIARSMGLGASEKTEGGFAPRSVREAEPSREQMRGAYGEMARGVRDRMGPVAATVDTVGRGLARVIPGMDHLAAGLDTITGTGRGDSFSDNLDRQRAMSSTDDTDRPVASYGAQVAGSLAAPTFGLLKHGVKGGAALGAGYGAAYGAAEGDTFGERAANAVTGGAVGGALGGAASKIVERLTRPTAAPAALDVASASNDLVAAGERLGVAVPRMIASDSRTVQAAGQVARQLPIGGERIERAADDFFGGIAGARDDAALRASGRPAPAAVPTAPEVGAAIRTGAEREVSALTRANEEARRAFEGLAPSAPAGTRAEVGDEVAEALQRRLVANREAQERPYQTLRGIIDADRAVPVSPRVGQALNRIMADRVAAGERSVPNDLAPVFDLATRPGGATFSGLQRARSTLGEMISDFTPGRGYSIGDLKTAYGALTDALRHTVVATARRGRVGEAQRAFADADSMFGRLSDANAEIGAALRSGNEALVDRMVAYASAKTGANLDKLRALQSALDPPQFERVSRLAFDRLGRGADGGFSPEALAKGWRTLSPEGRSALFGERVGRIDEAVGRIASTSERTAAAGKDIAALVSGTDSQVVDRLLAMASSGSRADLSRLLQARPIIGDDGMRGLASVAVQRLGTNAKGDFSSPIFLNGWAKLSDEGKRVLFPDGEVRRALDDIATLARRAVEVEGRFMNRSQTGRTVGWTAFGAGVMADPLSALATAVGGDLLSRALARPATAKAAASWSRAYVLAARQPTANAIRMLERSSRGLGSTLATDLGISKAAAELTDALIASRAQAPARAETEREDAYASAGAR